MMEVTLSPEEGTADFDMEGGCPLCDGTLSMRLRAGSSWGYCATCHSLQRKLVEMRNDSLEVMQPPLAYA